MLPEKKAVNLKTVAARVGLAPCSVSAILNDTEAARAIPQKTKDRVYRAAAELNYRPNILARSLRTKRTRMVAVVAPGLGRSGVARVVAAVQRRLHQSGYLLVLATCDGGDPNHLCAQFQQRGIEGIISIDANLPGPDEHAGHFRRPRLQDVGYPGLRSNGKSGFPNLAMLPLRPSCGRLRTKAAVEGCRSRRCLLHTSTCKVWIADSRPPKARNVRKPGCVALSSAPEFGTAAASASRSWSSGSSPSRVRARSSRCSARIPGA